MMQHRVLTLIGVTIVGLGIVSSCGGNHDFGFDGGGNDATADGGAFTDAPFIFPETGGSDGAMCASGCSSDLHSVVDCNGNQVAMCSGADGCDIKTGTCVNACQAAVDNQNSVGCEYYATHMENLLGSSLCFAATVANTWNTDAHITVEFNGTTLSNINSWAAIPTGKGQSITYTPYAGALPAGQVAMLFLGGTQGSPPECPMATAEGTAAMYSGTGIGHSFHITTDVPVVMYEISPYGGGSAAVTGSSLLLPVSAWDTNYVASTASPDYASPPGITIIASQDNTVVSFLPKVALTGGGGIPSGAANATVKFTLNTGEQAQIEQSTDLVGSVISASLPVGVMAGNPCMNTPYAVTYCDHGEQMLPPVRALGSEYVGVMYRPRSMEPAIWRLVGAVDGTTLTYSPSIPGAMDSYPAAATTLNQGDMKEFATGTPFIVTSQDNKHPFMLFEYMAGSSWSGMTNPDGTGNPDFSVQVPPQQYLSYYVIMTDPTYPETNLVLIRRPDATNTFQDVNIECLTGPITGWQPIGKYEWTRLDLQTGQFQDVNGCSNGRHQLTSNAPFGLNVWGWGTPGTGTGYVSYSYPGGMNVQPINGVIVPITPH